jgi:hypothetical protein
VCIGSAKDVEALFKRKTLVPDDPTPEESDLLDALEKKRVAIAFENTPMRDVVNFLRSLTKINIALVGEKISKVTKTMELRDARLGDVMRLVAGPDGRLAVISNCVCLGVAKDVEAVFRKKAIIPENPKENEIKLYGSLKEKRLDVSFESTPLVDVVNYLRGIANCNLVADDKILKDREVTFELRRASLDTVLRVMCGPELNYGIGQEVIYISTDERVKKMVGLK